MSLVYVVWCVYLKIIRARQHIPTTHAYTRLIFRLCVIALLIGVSMAMSQRFCCLIVSPLLVEFATLLVVAARPCRIRTSPFPWCCTCTLLPLAVCWRCTEFSTATARAAVASMSSCRFALAPSCSGWGPRNKPFCRPCGAMMSDDMFEKAKDFFFAHTCLFELCCVTV